MKRILTILLCIFILLSLFSGCSKEDGPVELWLVTEWSPDAEMNGQIKIMIEDYQTEHPNVTIHMDVLPSDPENRQDYLDVLHTKIIAGEGPDLYLMPTLGQLEDEPTDEEIALAILNGFPIPTSDTIKEPLFPDLTLQMQNGIFLDLADYYDADDTLGKEALNQTVMDAVVMDGRRYILPLRFDFPVLLADRETAAEYNIDVDSIDGSVDDFLSLAAEPFLPDYSFLGLSATPAASWFPGYIDYEANTINIESSEIVPIMGLYRSFAERKKLIGQPEILCVCNLKSYVNGDYFATDRYPIYSNTNNGNNFGSDGFPFYSTTLREIIENAAVNKAVNRDVSVIPIRATDGSLIADITYYGAIGAGCEHPDTAYDFLRTFLSEKAQWEQYRYQGSYDLAEEGYPVRTAGSVEAIWKNYRRKLILWDKKDIHEKPRRTKLIADTFTMNDSDVPLLFESIDHVRIPVILEYGDVINHYFTVQGNPEALAEQAIDDLEILLYEG